MTEPTTAAGRTLLDAFVSDAEAALDRGGQVLDWDGMRRRILVIEAEARQQDGSALRVATEELARTIYHVDRMIDRISRGKSAAGLYREWTHLVALFAEPGYQGSLDELRDRYLAALPPSALPADWTDPGVTTPNPDGSVTWQPTPPDAPHEHQFVNPANEVVEDNGYHVCMVCGLLRPPSAPPALDVERIVALAVRFANHGESPPPNDPCESCALATTEVLARLQEPKR